MPESMTLRYWIAAILALLLSGFGLYFVLYLARCRKCKKWYWNKESKAVSYLLYCSPECEQQSFEEWLQERPWVK
jgi:hypothetical protein